MKKLALLLLLTAIVSCQQEVEPSVDNINSVFKTQDFGIRFTMESGVEYRMGFLNNDISYFSPQETIRRELSYDDVRLINTFVGERFRESELELESKNSSIEIYNDTKKVIFNTPDFTAEFEELLLKLKLPYVSTEKK
jgi:hypothetical protein